MAILNHRSVRTVVSGFSASALLALLLLAVVFSGAASAQPALSVTKSGGKALLGANATVRITVTNTGNERGFNVAVVDTFTSVPLKEDDTNKTVEFVSATTSDGPLTPTSVTTDPLTGALTVRFDSIRDLMPTESVSIDVTVKTTDPEWAVGDVLHDEAVAKVNTRADGGGSWIEGTASADTEIVPIKMIAKRAEQSTAAGQATGCGELPAGGWPFSYTLEVCNNEVNTTNYVTVTDEIPDGVEYMGTTAGTNPNTVSRDNATGKTTLTWNIGDMDPGQTWTVRYSAGIRYDYFGTDNGGTNRPYNDYAGTPPLGAPVPNGASLRNTADLSAVYLDEPVSDSATARVTASYLTIAKGVTPNTSGNGGTVHFTITYTASQYYDGSGLVITDTLPDGLTYVDNSASTPPDTVQTDTPGPGQTTLIWNTLSDPLAGTQASITFDATVDDEWSDPPSPERTWILAGDTLVNCVRMDVDWADTVDTARTGDLQEECRASVVTIGPRPVFTKEAALDNAGSPGAYSHAVSATVGDTVWFRVRVNTADGENPEVDGVQFGNVDVIDWVPRGTWYVPSSASMNFGDEDDFHYNPPDVKFSSQYKDQPEPVSSGDLQGVAWSLGDISAGGWWEAEFRVVVQDADAVVGDNLVYDYGKLSGENSFNSQYSQRDVASITYAEPELEVEKDVTGAPSPLGAGSSVDYRITLTNEGTADARNVLVTDTLPVGMRGFDPTTGTVTVTRGTTELVKDTDYELSYTPATGVFLIDFDNGTTIDTGIPAPPSDDNVITIDYTAKVDGNTGAGASLANEAAATYSAQKSGSEPNRDYGPVMASANITLNTMKIEKSIVTSDPVPIGDGAGSQVTYRLTVTVPAGQVANFGSSNRIRDVVDQGAGMKYVTGSTELTDVSGSPGTPARFTDSTHPTDMDPTVTRVAPPSPSYTMSWDLRNDIDNSGRADDYVFQVEFKMLANGLIDPAGSATSPSNWYFWPNTGGDPAGANNRVRDRANFRWNNKATTDTVYSDYRYTYLQQPYLQLTKSNDRQGPPITPVKAGDTVRYTISITNLGQTTSYNNLVVDTLPAGMRDATPTTVSVTLNAASLTEGTDYFRSYNSSTGVLTFDFEGGSSPTDIPAGQTLVVVYEAQVDGDVGSGASMTNTAYVEYYSEDGGSGRHVRDGSDSTNSNRGSSTVQTPTATVTKAIVGPNPARIGQVVDYQLTITVPEGTDLYGPTIADVIQADGIEYKAGSSSLSDVSGSPTAPAAFSGSSDPSTNYGAPTPGATFTWALNDVKNTGAGVSGDYVFTLDFKCTVTGLVTPVSGGGSATDQGNWNWWWRTGGNPTADNIASDTGRVNWNDGTQNRSASSLRQTQTVRQPNLDLVKVHTGSSTVAGGGVVPYVITITNSGTSTAYEVVVEDILDIGMRGTDPSASVAATLNAVSLTAGEDFVAGFDSGSGKLTVDFTAGSGGPTVVPAGQVLVVGYDGTVNSDIGAGATLANIASVAFASDTGADARRVPTNTNVSERNTDDDSVTTPAPTITKTRNVPSANLGQPFRYAVDVTVPARTTLYSAEVTDTVVDGLTVDAHARYLDSDPRDDIGVVTRTPQGDGTTSVTWDIGDWENDTSDDQHLRLELDVHVDLEFNDSTPVRGLPPQSEFANRANLGWDDAGSGGTHRTLHADSLSVLATEPRLVLTNVNDAGAPVVGNQAVHYTVEVVNEGTGTSYMNEVVVTFPVGMRGNAPVLTQLTLAGAPLVENADYWVSWNPTTGELTIDLDHGVSQTNILTGAGNRLVASITASASQDAGAGAKLDTLASIGYNSWSGSNGKATPRTDDPSDDNTKESSITMQSASVAKNHDATGNITTIGHSFNYKATVTVPARTTLYDAVVSDTVPDGLTVTGVTPSTGTAQHQENPLDGTTDVTWDIGGILGHYTNDSDGPRDIDLLISVRVDRTHFGGADVVAGDVFANTADLEWYDAPSGGTLQEDSADAANVTVREPALVVEKSADPTTPEAGGNVDWTITVRNDGLWPAYDVTVDDTVDSRLAYDAGTIYGPGATDTDPVNLTWYVQTGHGPVMPGETVTLGYGVTVNGGVTQGQVIENTASVPSYNGDQPQEYGREYGPAEDTGGVTARAASLGVVKDVTDNPNPDWGEEVTYRITVTNNGDADARGVGIRDTLPSPHFSYVDGSTNAVWPGGTSTDDPSGTDPTRTWSLDATLAPGEQLVLTFRMSVDEWAAFGTAANVAVGFGEDGAGSPLPEHGDTTDIDVKQHPSVTVGKVLDDPDGYVPIGYDFSYTITVTNSGNTNIPVVPLADAYDENFMEFRSATITPSSETPGSIAWDDLTGRSGLAPQQTATVTLTFKALRAGAMPDTNNTAEVDTTDSEGNPVTGEDTNTSLVITDPRIEVTKTLDHPDSFVPVGNELTYVINVENTGDTDVVQPVRLVDTFDPEFLAFVGASPAQSAVGSGAVTWDDISLGSGIPAGSSVDVTVTFRALKPGGTPDTDNRADASAVDAHGDPVSGQDVNTGLVLTNPRIAVRKTLGPKQPAQVKVGADVTFRLVFSNTGDTRVMAPVPVVDRYNKAYMSFVRASIAPDPGGKEGTLKWSDISAGRGFRPGQYKIIDVVFKTLKEGTAPNTTDWMTVPELVDEHGDPVAGGTSSAYLNVGAEKVLGSTDWFVAEGSTGGGFDTWILLQNPQKVDANVEVTFTTHEGPRQPEKVVVLGKTRYTMRIQDFVPDDFHVSTIVKSDVPIVVERSMYWDKRFWGASGVAGVPQPYEMKAGHANGGTPMDSVALARPDTRKTMYFPEGSTAPGFDTWILLCNPGNADANVRLSLMTPSGAVDGGTALVPALSRQTVHLNDLLPNVDQVSVRVASDQPIVAERSMYWDPNAEALEPYEMKGGHASPGSYDTSREWFIAEGSTAEGFETYVLVQNPGDASARVTATFMTAKGVAAEKTVKMLPGSRSTFRVSEYVDGDYHVATKVTADRPVVAERSMYWDKRVTSLVPLMSEGHSSTGCIACGSKWMVPEGSTGGGFDYWVLVSNPKETDTEAIVTFMTASGPREPFKIKIPATSRYTLRVSDYVPDDFHVSTLVETEGKIVVERAMYWDKRARAGIQPYEMMGGHSTTGVDP